MIVVSAELVEIRRKTYVISAGTVLVGAAMIGSAPPRPDGLQALDGVAALQVAIDGEAIECPSTAELLVWPEGHLEDPRRADEGPADYQIDELCSKGSPPASHVIGMVVLGEFGLLNAAAFVDPSSTVRQIRAKRALVPFEGFSHGQEAPILDFQGRAVGIFICFEVLSRSLAAEAVEAGAEFFAVLASDRPLLGSIVAQDQWIAALSMRAAEFGLPAVRASIGGTAVVIDANGRLSRRGRAAVAEFVVP